MHLLLRDAQLLQGNRGRRRSTRSVMQAGPVIRLVRVRYGIEGETPILRANTAREMHLFPPRSTAGRIRLCRLARGLRRLHSGFFGLYRYLGCLYPAKPLTEAFVGPWRQDTQRAD